MADDYFTAINRVEDRREIAPLPKPVEEPKMEDGVVKEQENPQLVTWPERLSLHELCLAERMEIVELLKYSLSLNIAYQHSPPVSAIAGAEIRTSVRLVP